jgi:hypothetical protein
MRRRDAAAASLIFALAIAGCGKQTEQQMTSAYFRHYLDSLETELAVLRQATEHPSPRMLHPISETDVQELKRGGLGDPIPDVVNDLVAHPEIIPGKTAFVGGRFGFYNVAGIRVLNRHWVLAPFDDGHVGGDLILQYEVDEGKIRWKVLQSEMD